MGLVSANTLFHFTPKLDYLEGILKSNFIPSYSLEKIILGKANITKRLITCYKSRKNKNNLKKKGVQRQ